ncbi:MAG: hypothetical protein JNK11_03800 [Alphaproteobacteria bacterium]|nr:hypothetical protein [Alphaproteobacteria bacterium]
MARAVKRHKSASDAMVGPKPKRRAADIAARKSKAARRQAAPEPSPVERFTDVISGFLDPANDNASSVARQARVHRIETATTIVELARDMVADAGGSMKAPPLKFFVPFLEKCSLEDEDIDLQARWAALLASASLSYDPTHRLFADVLDRLNPDGAHFIDDLYRDFVPDWPPARHSAPEFANIFANVPDFNVALRSLPSIQKDVPSWASTTLFPTLRRGCRKIFGAHLDALQPLSGSFGVFASLPNCFASLKALGLLQRAESKEILPIQLRRDECRLKAHQLTDFAIEFLRAVTPRNLPRWLKPAAYQIVRLAEEPPAAFMVVTEETSDPELDRFLFGMELKS